MSRDLYLQQKGVVEKETLNRISDLERLLKEHLGVEKDLSGISKKQGNYLYAMFFKRDIEAIKNFK